MNTKNYSKVVNFSGKNLILIILLSLSFTIHSQVRVNFTPREAIAIEKQARDVKQAKRAAAADGQITLKERAKIARQDKQLDRTINRKKHN